METNLIFIVVAACSILSAGLVFFYVRDKLLTNRKFKPIEVKEAEAMVKRLIKKRYGSQKNYMRLFYEDFVKLFPQFNEEHYSYTYLLQCLSPQNTRSNADLIECALTFFEKPLIVVGSINHEMMMERESQ